MKRSLSICLALLATPAVMAAPPAEPEARQRVIEDDGVRIEELRVRGLTQRIVVRPKTADVRPYQILPGDPADPRRASSGQRVWQILSF